jgi:hypothetical protein
MARQAPRESALDPETNSCEAELVLQMALETGCLGPRVVAAADRLVSQGRFGALSALLAGAPDTRAAEALWGHLATPERLQHKLDAASVDFTAVEALAVRLGAAAADPLLDYLQAATGKTRRARTPAARGGRLPNNSSQRAPSPAARSGERFASPSMARFSVFRASGNCFLPANTIPRWRWYCTLSGLRRAASRRSWAARRRRSRTPPRSAWSTTSA